MPNLPYHFARFEGETMRRLYRAALPTIVRRKVSVQRELSLDVFAYSGESTLPEQVASIRSFLAYAGRPKRFTVFSDGSHRAASIELLEEIDSVIHVCVALPALSSEIPERIRPYLTTHPTGKQLRIIMSLPEKGPSLYVDSDVLFFAGAADLLNVAQTNDVRALYLADCEFAGDERLLLEPTERRNPANTGFLLLFQKLDWSLGLQRLLELEGEPTFFTNQTIVHLCMHTNGARALDPRKYILQLDDQFLYRDRYANGTLAMRHYVNPVRHKFWMNFARGIQQ